MKHCVQKLATLIIVFLLTAISCFAVEPVKINELIFDNSDSIIFLKSKGDLTDENTVTKGYLKDPDRIYIDINNSILTTPKKLFNAKYSSFNNIKISQFSLEPSVVRIVFEYNKTLDLSAFKIFKAGNSIIIQTKKDMVNSPKYKTVYSNTPIKERTPFYLGAKFEEDNNIPPVKTEENKDEVTLKPKTDAIQIDNKIQKVNKLSSKYYIDSITQTKDGILLNGIGKISLMPSFTLKEPERLIIDLDDAVLSPDLRNKAISIGKSQTLVPENGEKQIDTRETLKLGQNSQSVVRLVIQGANAKNYRGIISPDSKSLYITNKSNIINSKMSDNTANLLKTSYTGLKETEAVYFAFDDSVTFNTFEENSNLYLDINNLNTFDDGLLDPILRAVPNFQTTRLALDKLRAVIPNVENKNVLLKTNPDNTEIRITLKPKPKEPEKPKVTPGSVFVPTETSKKKKTDMYNFYKVVIDAGHGGTDVGATRNGIYEKDITLKVAKLVEKKLGKKKVKTYMIRSNDKYVSLQERSDYSNEIKPDVFVSIHVNSSTNDVSYGIETHWYKEDSNQYARYVHKEMSKKVKDWKTTDRGLFNSKFYVINHTEAPAILCEIGFISNKAEREQLITEKRQEEIADAIANGIYNYLKAKK